MQTPSIYARFDTKDGAFKVTDFNITLERQRPAVYEFKTEEPLPDKSQGIFSQGFLGYLKPVTPVVCESSSQLDQKSFEHFGIDPLRYLLDVKYQKQLVNVDLDACFSRIAQDMSLSFANQTGKEAPAKSPVFLGSLRNALDQISQVYGLKEERWHIDLISKKLVLTKGFIDAEPVEIEPLSIVEEFDSGIEMDIYPQMRPFLKILHRDVERIVDSVRFDSKSNSMFVQWVSV